MIQVNDLIQPGAKQIASPVVSGFFGRILPLRCDEGITTGDSRETSKSKLQSSEPSSLKSLQSQNLPRPENRLSLNALAIVHGRLTADLYQYKDAANNFEVRNFFGALA